MSLVVKVSASQPESLDFESRMRQREFSQPRAKGSVPSRHLTLSKIC